MKIRRVEVWVLERGKTLSVNDVGSLCERFVNAISIDYFFLHHRAPLYRSCLTHGVFSSPKHPCCPFTRRRRRSTLGVLYFISFFPPLYCGSEDFFTMLLSFCVFVFFYLFDHRYEGEREREREREREKMYR